jgi:hypothetical protein
MSTLTLAAALSIANACVGPALAPVMVGIAQHESNLNPIAQHLNLNGSWDIGIAQVNTSNFGWTGLTMATALDPCANFQAGAKVLFAKYNGSPPDGVKAAYAADVIAKIPTESAPLPPANDPADPQPPSWDIEAVAEWRRRHAPTPEDVQVLADEPTAAEIINKESK